MVDQLQKAVEEKLKEEEWQDCFLIDIEQSGKKIQVFIDSDEAITFGRCKKMSRHLEPILDEANFSGGKYVLEVSSPGLDRPLKLERQYLKNIGRNIKFVLKEDEGSVTGKLLSYKDGTVTLETLDPEDKKRKNTIEQTLDLDNVKKALVQISFK